MSRKTTLGVIFGSIAVMTLGGGSLYGMLPLSVQGLGGELAAKPEAVRACIWSQLSEAETEHTVNRFSLRRMENNCSRT